MSTSVADIDVDVPRVYAEELYVAALVVADVWLTKVVAIDGPATEVGLGAVHLIAGAGWPALLAAQVAATVTAFGSARVVAKRDRVFGASIRGFVAGFWAVTVVGNLAIAVQAGVLP